MVKSSQQSESFTKFELNFQKFGPLSVSSKPQIERLIAEWSKMNIKIDAICIVLGLVTPNCWMASLDLKDACYSIRIHTNFQKYLEFMYNGRLFDTQFFLMVFPLVLENSLKC